MYHFYLNIIFLQATIKRLDETRDKTAIISLFNRLSEIPSLNIKKLILYRILWIPGDEQIFINFAKLQCRKTIHRTQLIYLDLLVDFRSLLLESLVGLLDFLSRLLDFRFLLRSFLSLEPLSLLRLSLLLEERLSAVRDRLSRLRDFRSRLELRFLFGLTLLRPRLKDRFAPRERLRLRLDRDRSRYLRSFSDLSRSRVSLSRSSFS